MTLWDDKPAPVLTVNFTKLAVAFHQAIARKEIIGVISPEGIGFKYALKHFVEKHYLKVVYCNVKYSESIRGVLLNVYRHLCNVKFSNLDYRNTTVFDLARVLNERLKFGDSCLLCIDKCSNLKPAQLEYFIQFLNDFNKPIGLVFRMSDHFADQLLQKKKFHASYKKLIQVVDNWRVLQRCSDDEVRDIVLTKFRSSPMLVDDLVTAANGNLSILNRHLERIEKYHQSS